MVFCDFVLSTALQVKMYAEDPLVYHGSLKAKWGAALSESMKAVRPRVGEIKLPLLIFQGTDDRLVPFSASQFVMDNVGAEDKTFKVRMSVGEQYIALALFPVALQQCRTTGRGRRA